MRSFALRTSRTQMGQTQTSESCRQPGPEIYPVIYPAIYPAIYPVIYPAIYPAILVGP